MKIYPLGDSISVSAMFTDPLQNIARNPSSVVLRIRDPAGIETRPAVTNPAVGLFTAEFLPTSAGIWSLRWEGRGGVTKAIEHQFEVVPSAFPSS